LPNFTAQFLERSLQELDDPPLAPGEVQVAHHRLQGRGPPVRGGSRRPGSGGLGVAGPSGHVPLFSVQPLPDPLPHPFLALGRNPGDAALVQPVHRRAGRKEQRADGQLIDGVPHVRQDQRRIHFRLFGIQRPPKRRHSLKLHRVPSGRSSRTIPSRWSASRLRSARAKSRAALASLRISTMRFTSARTSSSLRPPVSPAGSSGSRVGTPRMPAPSSSKPARPAPSAALAPSSGL